MLHFRHPTPEPSPELRAAHMRFTSGHPIAAALPVGQRSPFLRALLSELHLAELNRPTLYLTKKEH